MKLECRDHKSLSIVRANYGRSGIYKNLKLGVWKTLGLKRHVFNKAS